MRLGRRARNLVTGLLEASAFLTALFSVATAFDFLHRYLELFSHFRLQYFAASVLLALTLALLRRPRYVLLMLIVSAINAAYVLPWYMGSREGSGPEVTVLLVNVLSANHDLERLKAAVETEQPDLILLQELTPAHLPQLESLRATYPHSITETRDDNFGIGAWSRVPLRDSTVIDTPPRGYPSLVLVVELEPGPLTIISTHPFPPLGRGNYDARNEQLAYIAEMANGTVGSAAIIGDLNTSMWGTNYRALLDETGYRDARKGHGVLPSWPLFMPFAMIPIDHALLSPDLVASETRTLPSIGSDHLPLLVRIQRP